MNKSHIHFGTDGWRARIADEFTFDNVKIVAQAISDYIRGDTHCAQPTMKIIVGYDRRFLSNEYARTLSEVLVANNIKVFLTDKATPTPAISFAIKTKALNGGVIITASHNPPEFNGIKFKTHLAAPADEKTTKNIENFIGKNRINSIDFDSAIRLKKIELVDVSKEYINNLKRYVDVATIGSSKLRILIDYMHGSGAGYLEKVLSTTSCRLDTMRKDIDPLFGGVNPEPIPKNLEAVSYRLKAQRYDLVIALDGDADRIGAIRPDGGYITSGQIISLILLHFLEDKGLRGSVVKTISGTILIDRICERFGLKLFETPVGFKHISEFMMKEDVLIGGEESGGIGFCNYIPERDGILSGLLLLEMIAQRKESIISIMDKIDKMYGRFCYKRLDIDYHFNKAKILTERLRRNPPERLEGGRIAKIETYDGIKFIMEDSSWLLLRFSGTEPIIRLYAESHSDKDVELLLKTAKKILRRT